MPSQSSYARSQLDRSIMSRIGKAVGEAQLSLDEGPVPDALAVLVAKLREAERGQKPTLLLKSRLTSTKEAVVAAVSNAAGPGLGTG